MRGRTRPGAAAERAVPVRIELCARVESLVRRSLGCWQRGQEARRAELRAADVLVLARLCEPKGVSDLLHALARAERYILRTRLEWVRDHVGRGGRRQRRLRRSGRSRRRW